MMVNAEEQKKVLAVSEQSKVNVQFKPLCVILYMLQHLKTKKTLFAIFSTVRKVKEVNPEVSSMSKLFHKGAMCLHFFCSN